MQKPTDCFQHFPTICCLNPCNHMERKYKHFLSYLNECKSPLQPLRTLLSGSWCPPTPHSSCPPPHCDHRLGLSDLVSAPAVLASESGLAWFLNRPIWFPNRLMWFLNRTIWFLNQTALVSEQLLNRPFLVSES